MIPEVRDLEGESDFAIFLFELHGLDLEEFCHIHDGGEDDYREEVGAHSFLEGARVAHRPAVVDRVVDGHVALKRDGHRQQDGPGHGRHVQRI